MQLTKNFSKAEFDCKDGSLMPAFALENIKKLANNLQILRDVLGKKITINSGYRSVAHNRNIGGKPQSQHLTGKAADIVVEGMPPKQVAQVLERLIKEGKIAQGGIGIYRSFVHYDIRGVKARWDFSKQKQ